MLIFILNHLLISIMKLLISLSILSYLAIAAPVQDGDLAAAFNKRTNCDLSGFQYDYLAVTSPDDSPESFLNWPGFVVPSTPSHVGYVSIPGFENLHKAVQIPGFLGLISLYDYNPDVCALQCSRSVPGCKSFNICKSAEFTSRSFY